MFLALLAPRPWPLSSERAGKGWEEGGEGRGGGNGRGGEGGKKEGRGGKVGIGGGEGR